MPKVASIDETLDKIIISRCSVSRFGDGELSILLDKASYPFQKFDSEMAKLMAEILFNNDSNILVCLPRGYHSLDNLTSEGSLMWRAHIAWTYPRLKKYLNLSSLYYNASMTRLYIGVINTEAVQEQFIKVKRIWTNRSVVLVEGQKSRLGVNNDLFDAALSVKRILAPAHNAFDKSYEIINAVKAFDKDTLVLMALGPTATVLTYQLTKEGYQAIDIGNIDLEYEWFRAKAKKKFKVPGKYTSEVKGGIEVDDIESAEYQRQIVKIIN